MMKSAAFLMLLPRNLCVLVLHLYRALISPLYGDVCRYYPSCSSYMLLAVQRHGVLRGCWFGLRRITRCHPWAPGGVDDVPQSSRQRYAASRFGFVVLMATER